MDLVKESKKKKKLAYLFGQCESRYQIMFRRIPRGIVRFEIQFSRGGVDVGVENIGGEINFRPRILVVVPRR